MKTICLIGGNTLGHVIPGVSVGRMIRQKYPMCKIIYITSNKQKDLQIIKDSNFDIVDYIQVESLTRFKEFKMFFKIRKYFINLFEKQKVDLVIGFGSFISSIGILSAQKLNIDTIIHEQNKILGLGNKLCYFKCKKLLSNFNLNKKLKKLEVVGNPILVCNQNIIKKEKLVITSGSGGAKAFNSVIVDFLNQYEGSLDITFITGKKYFEEVKSKLTNSLIRVEPFIDDLGSYLQDVKYIITRAGATTLSEVFELNILPIIIPSPNVKNNHQYFNALEYSDNSILILEKDLTVEKLNEAIDQLKNIKPIIKNSNKTAVLKFVEVVNNVKRLY